MWSSCTNAEAKRLEALFNYDCCLVLRKPRFYSASSARQELAFTPLSDRRESHMCQTIYKCLNSLSPSYLSRLFAAPSTHHNTRASSTNKLNVPLTRSSFWKKHSALLVLWHGYPSQAMFEFARIIPHSLNCAVHDQFLLHEYCTYMNPEYFPLPLLHVFVPNFISVIYYFHLPHPTPFLTFVGAFRVACG